MEKRSRKKMKCLLSALLLSGVWITIGARVSQGADARPAGKGAVLDFEADVIEGEKRKPDIFLQMEGGAASMDAILYSREDFNDYAEIDQKMRPRVRRIKGGGAPRP